MVSDALHDFGDLLGGLRLAKNHFRDALAQGAMMIDHRLAGIFEGQGTQTFQTLIDTQVAVLHRGQ